MLAAPVVVATTNFYVRQAFSNRNLQDASDEGFVAQGYPRHRSHARRATEVGELKCNEGRRRCRRRLWLMIDTLLTPVGFRRSVGASPDSSEKVEELREEAVAQRKNCGGEALLPQKHGGGEGCVPCCSLEAQREGEKAGAPRADPSVEACTTDGKRAQEELN